MPSPYFAVSAVGDRRHGLVIRQAAAGQAPLLLDFGNGCDAVIGGEDDERVVETDQLVDARQQNADGAIGPDGDVVHLGLSGPKVWPTGSFEEKLTLRAGR